jgi:hypothetical protein
LFPASDGGKDALGIGGPDEGLRLTIVLGNGALDRGLKVHDRAEHPAPELPFRQRCKERLDRIDLPTSSGCTPWPNGRFWHLSEETLWSAHAAVSGPSFHLLFVAL